MTKGMLMKKKLFYRSVCALSAAVMLIFSGCGDQSSSSAGSSESGADSSASSATDSAAGGDDSSFTVVTSREREEIPAPEVTETTGDFDLSEVQNKSDVPEDFEVSEEAEKCKLSGSAKTVDKEIFGKFTGDGYIALGSGGDAFEFEAEFPADGSYDFVVRAASSNSNNENFITVDGEQTSTFIVNEKEFTDCVAEKVNVKKGKHKIGVQAKNGSFFVDSLKVTAAKPVDLTQFDVEKTLVNPDASDETKRLYSFLCDVYGKYMISGQYASDNRGVESPEFDEYNLKTGKYPAMMGLDLIEASPSRQYHGSSPGLIVQTAKDWYDRNGIVTICWHWNAPEDYLEVNGAAWWEGFYSDKTSFSLAKALSGEDQKGYDYLIRDIDAIAMYLQELDDNHVPVLWRPLHEGGGDPKWNNPWFWWGSSGAEAYKELWKLMYDRLTNVHHCNNLIWVWNGQNVDYYPGDEYVDIVGYDSYPEVHGDHSPQKSLWDYTKGTPTKNKIVAMTENGSIPDPDSCFSEGIRWSFFCTWNGEFALKDYQLGSEHNDLDFFKKIVDHERVLTLDEMPDLKSWPMS